jgi:hypothetical protein
MNLFVLIKTVAGRRPESMARISALQFWQIKQKGGFHTKQIPAAFYLIIIIIIIIIIINIIIIIIIII